MQGTGSKNGSPGVDFFPFFHNRGQTTHLLYATFITLRLNKYTVISTNFGNCDGEILLYYLKYNIKSKIRQISDPIFAVLNQYCDNIDSILCSIL